MLQLRSYQTALDTELWSLTPPIKELLSNSTICSNIQSRCVGFRCLRILKDWRCPRAPPAVPEICTYRIYEQDMYNTAAHGVRDNCTQMDYSCSGPSQRYLKIWRKVYT